MHRNESFCSIQNIVVWENSDDNNTVIFNTILILILKLVVLWRWFFTYFSSCLWFLFFVVVFPWCSCFITHHNTIHFQLYAILEDVNHILDDERMGGGDHGGHSLVLAMHMLKEQQSFHRFLLLLTDHFSHLCEGLNCLHHFNKSLTQVRGVHLLLLLLLLLYLIVRFRSLVHYLLLIQMFRQPFSWLSLVKQKFKICCFLVSLFIFTF